MERALAQRQVMATQGWPLAEVYRQKSATSYSERRSQVTTLKARWQRAD